MSLAQQTGGLEVLQSGERTDPSGKPVSNILLLSIPDEEYKTIRLHLSFVVAPYHRVFHEPRQSIRHVYFPNAGIISLVITTQDGRSVEAGISGKEGCVGGSIAVGLDMSLQLSVSQVAGDGLQISTPALKSVLGTTPQLRHLLYRHAQVQALLVAQSAACNRLHGIEQRLARWLLMTQDRLDSGSVPLTHEFLAGMLGSGRPSVSLAAAILQKQGLIEYTRGDVRVVDRKGLEGVACECYRMIQQFNGDLGLK